MLMSWMVTYRKEFFAQSYTPERVVSTVKILASGGDLERFLEEAEKNPHCIVERSKIEEHFLDVMHDRQLCIQLGIVGKALSDNQRAYAAAIVMTHIEQNKSFRIGVLEAHPLVPTLSRYGQ